MKLERRLYVKVVLLIVFFLSSYSLASSYQLILENGHFVKWSDQDMPIPYYINPSGFSDDEIKAIHSAFDKWGSVLNSKLKFEFKGYIDKTVNIENPVCDSKNIIVKPDAGSDRTSAWMVHCDPISDKNGFIRGADIIFNDHFIFQWSTSEQIFFWQVDMESNALHEIGHFIGLDHPHGDEFPDPELRESVLEPVYWGDQCRDLYPDDIAAVQFLYGDTSFVNPTIAMMPMSGPPGTTFVEWGTGFMPYGTATLHFRKPDGTEYKPLTLPLDSIGHFEITYNSETNKPPGQYSWWAIDNTTGTKSNVVTFTITSQNYSISGNVSLNKSALSGVTMRLSGSTITSTITDASGNYTFSGLLNGSYITTPERIGYAFIPSQQIVNISNESIKNVNFSAIQTFNPTIAMTPMSGPPGTTFIEWGTGFTPNGTATLHFLKPDGSEYTPMTLQLDSIGHFEITYHSEANKPPGTYSWYAIDNATGYKSNVVTFTITVKPTIAMTPMSGPPGTHFVEWGTGFTPNGTATLYFPKYDLIHDGSMTVTLDQDGHFEIPYDSGTNKPPGIYSWYAIDNTTGYKSNTVTYTITVKPIIAMSPMSGPPGTHFVEWGTGFTPNGTATLYFPKYDGKNNGSMNLTLDAIGHFEITYNSEMNKPPGTYSWYAIDNTTGKKSNTVYFTITK